MQIISVYVFSIMSVFCLIASNFVDTNGPSRFAFLYQAMALGIIAVALAITSKSDL